MASCKVGLITNSCCRKMELLWSDWVTYFRKYVHPPVLLAGNRYDLQQKLSEGIQHKVLLKSGQTFRGNIRTFRQNDPDTVHVSFFFRGFFETFFTPSALKNYVTVPKKNMKMHFWMLPVSRQVTDILFLFEFYNNLHYTQGAHFYSIEMPKKKY
jgi:hypothetical protein